MPEAPSNPSPESVTEFDLFISHAFEDKDAVARPLAKILQDVGVRVWFDETALQVGDSLTDSINRGLEHSRFGAVILSPAFLGKGWPEYELRSLVTKEVGSAKVILPIWHNVDARLVKQYSLWLADKVALDTSKKSITEIALALLRVVRPEIFHNLLRLLVWKQIVRNGEPGYARPGDLLPGPIRHAHLPEAFLVRLTTVWHVLGPSLGFDKASMIENFQPDAHPNEELRVWERVAAAFLCLTSAEGGDAADKRKLVGDLIGLTMEHPEVTLERLKLGDAYLEKLVTALEEASRMPAAEGDRKL